MTQDDVESLLLAQNSQCAICLKPVNLTTMRIDHNHATGQVRGILCHRCNLWCAAFDDEGFRARAVSYLSE